MSATCRRIQRLLEESAPELSAAERADVEAHLQQCQDCRAADEEIRMVDRLLAHWEPEPPSADLGARIRQAISEAPPPTVGLWSRLGNALSAPWNWTLPVPAAVAAVLVTAVVSQLEFGTSPPEQPVTRGLGPIAVPAPAPNPIEVFVGDTGSALATVAVEVPSFGGRIVAVRSLDGVLEVTCGHAGRRDVWSEFLALLGEADVPDTGYLDGNGNLVIRLRPRQGRP